MTLSSPAPLPLQLVTGPKNYSSWSVRAWLALKAANLEFQEIPIHFGEPGAKEQILGYSPAGTVPILLHGDTRVWVSLAICEYVAELAPHAQLWPDDPSARAHARAVSAEMVGGFPNLRTQHPMNVRARYSDFAKSPEVKAEIERICGLWRECRERFGSGGAFLFGAFTIADAMYAPVVSRFFTYGVKPGPVEAAYMEAVWSHPAVKEWVELARAETERLGEYEH
jgi:glutathione S-transferase